MHRFGGEREKKREREEGINTVLDFVPGFGDARESCYLFRKLSFKRLN